MSRASRRAAAEYVAAAAAASVTRGQNDPKVTETQLATRVTFAKLAAQAVEKGTP